MRIEVKPVGLIKKYASAGIHDVADGITSRGLIELLARPRQFKMVSYVNGKKGALVEPLADGDEVKLTTLLTGG